MIHIYKCKKTSILIGDICMDTTCEWWLKSKKFFNCTWVACNYGPFTLDEVGKMMGVTRERIRQIEDKAIKKLQLTKRKAILKDFAELGNDQTSLLFETIRKSKIKV
jgi:hypothetical protein